MAREPLYSLDQRHRILAIARRGVEAALRRQRHAEAPGEDEAYLADPRGCFVTLENRGALRGCIGTFSAERSLLDNLLEMSAAVVCDPRFVMHPVTLDELDALNIEVSVLTPMQPMDDPTRLVLGEEGIFIEGRRAGMRVSGCFLPQVAVEQGWDVETTLSMCCAHKMGLAPDAWRPPTRLKFYRFGSAVISEESLHHE